MAQVRVALPGVLLCQILVANVVVAGDASGRQILLKVGCAREILFAGFFFKASRLSHELHAEMVVDFIVILLLLPAAGMAEAHQFQGLGRLRHLIEIVGHKPCNFFSA